MNSFRSLVAILSLLKAMNGKNIERYPHPLSLMCVSVLDLLLVLDYICLFVSAIISWSGMQRLRSWMGFSMRFGQAKMQFRWIMLWNWLCRYGFLRFAIFLVFLFDLNLRSPSSSLVLQVIAIDFLLFCRMLKITAFGKEMTWNEDKTVMPKGHQVTMKDALHVVSSGIFAKIIFPDWSLQLTKRLQIIKISFEEFQVQITHFTDIDVFEPHHICRCICLKWSRSGKVPKRYNAMTSWATW